MIDTPAAARALSLLLRPILDLRARKDPQANFISVFRT